MKSPWRNRFKPDFFLHTTKKKMNDSEQKSDLIFTKATANAYPYFGFLIFKCKSSGFWGNWNSFNITLSLSHPLWNGQNSEAAASKRFPPVHRFWWPLHLRFRHLQLFLSSNVSCTTFSFSAKSSKIATNQYIPRD